MTRTHAVLDSPVGPLVGVVQDGALVRLGPDPTPDPDVVGQRDDDALPALREQLDAYWAGTLREFDLPLGPPGTPWQQQVWAALRTIPFGETWTYGELAAHLGRPTAARAVGAANGRNPVFLVVPDDLAAALRAEPAAQAAWDGFPPSAKKLHLQWIGDAKRPETRAGRVAQTVEAAARGERARR